MAKLLRGATLIELLVAMLIAAFVLTTVTLLMIQGSRLLARMQAMTAMRSAGSSSVNRMAREVELSAWNTITITPVDQTVVPPVPEALALRISDANSSSANFTPSAGFIIYWLTPIPVSPSYQLMRKTWPVSANGTPDPVQLPTDPLSTDTQLQPSDIAAIVATPNGSETIMANNVTALTFTPAVAPVILTAASQPTNLLTIDLNCSLTLTTNNIEIITGQWHTAVVPRNPAP